MAKRNGLGPIAKEWPTARRWTEEQARAALEALASSGEGVAAFATRHGIDAQRVHCWRRRLSRSVTITPPTFVEVVPAARPMVAPFEIVLPKGEVVRVPVPFDAEALARVLAAVRGQGPC